ncbi:MAG: hypothetical protein ACREBE_14010, partial [bacterium]
MLGSKLTAIVSLTALASIALGETALGQPRASVALPPGEPARFLQRYIGLTSAEVEQVGAGTVVTKVLPTKDNDEVALFGIVTLDASRDDVVRRVRDLPSFLRAPERTAFGLFGTPAAGNDLKDFVVDPSDLDAIKSCRIGDCDVKLPAGNIDQFRGGIEGLSPAAARAVIDSLVRERVAVYVNRYRAGGTAAMVEYGDQKTPGRASDVFTSLLAESPYVFDYLPTFHQYLEAYPAASLPGVTDAIYWAYDKMPSLRPILSVNHVSVYSPSTRLTLVSTKQLYASHYFLGAFTLTTVIDRPDAPSGHGVYY